MINIIENFRDYRQSTSLNFFKVKKRTGIINNIAVNLHRYASM